MSFNVKVISTLNGKNTHEFSMFCDLCVTRMVRFRLKSFSCILKIYSQIFFSVEIKLSYRLQNERRRSLVPYTSLKPKGTGKESETSF